MYLLIDISAGAQRRTGKPGIMGLYFTRGTDSPAEGKFFVRLTELIPFNLRPLVVRDRNYIVISRHFTITGAKKSRAKHPGSYIYSAWRNYIPHPF